MPSAPFLNQAFAEAFAKYRDLNEKWVAVSWKVGGSLPTSLLSNNIQRLGRLDLLIRSLEDEVNAGLDENDIFTFDHLAMLSEVWVGGEYEIFRLLRQRKRSGTNALFPQILKFLELLRMPMEKHEIAKDRRLQEPLQLQRSPPNNDETDFYEYDKNDDSRSHIMPSAVSGVNGSLMWHVIDLENNTSYWIERRWLSDQILELWSG